MNRRRFIQSSLSVAAITPYLHAEPKEIRADVAVIGGGTGGVAAALAALRSGASVVLTEETDWLGGQLTAQAVPPDENPWIEEYGCTHLYRSYRTAVRDYYRQNFPLTDAAKSLITLNPGNGSVSRLTHEFKVSVAVLGAMLRPYVVNGKLTLLMRHMPVSSDVNHDRVMSVTVRDQETDYSRVIQAGYFIDATELGELLPLTGTEFVTGSEARSETGELHAASHASPSGSQAFTYCFAMDYLQGEDHTIDRPHEYDYWRNFVPPLKPQWSGKLLSWTACHTQTLEPSTQFLDPNPKDTKPGNFWLYRRIADRGYMKDNAYSSDITLVNWPQNDYIGGDLNTALPEDRKRYLAAAKQQALSLLYWMQTEAPRLDGGIGFKGLRLRNDVVDTKDGLAKYPYIRESRRIRAQFTVSERHVGTDMRMQLTGRSKEDVRAERFDDSVGIGCYRIDLHPSASGCNYIDTSALPFQIPLGALLPQRIRNLLAGAKNVGTTHIANGCFRLHPVEWNCGEAAGAAAAYAVATKLELAQIRDNKKMLKDFQASLVKQGFELQWREPVNPV